MPLEPGIEAERRRQAWAKAGLFASPGLAAGELLGADYVGIARVQRQWVQLDCRTMALAETDLSSLTITSRVAGMALTVTRVSVKGDRSRRVAAVTIPYSRWALRSLAGEQVPRICLRSTRSIRRSVCVMVALTVRVSIVLEQGCHLLVVRSQHVQGKGILPSGLLRH
jgi:hypothetical protein